MIESPATLDEIVEEAHRNPFKSDSIGIFLNQAGQIKFKHLLQDTSDSLNPLYTVSINPENIRSVLTNVLKLMPYQKGILLKLIAPQKRRKLVSLISAEVLNYINKMDMESYINIIHELTANSEKANLQHLLFQKGLATTQQESVQIIRKDRDQILLDCDESDKWVKISWKFSDQLMKVEIKNNTPIDMENLNGIQNKMTTELNHLADGFTGELEDKLGAGLGLFFVNFFRNEVRERYNFETIFRIYQNDLAETVTNLTVIFEKNQ